MKTASNGSVTWEMRVEYLNDASGKIYSFKIIRDHEQHNELLAVSHRFRAVDEAGFFALAKDLARLTAESFDISAIHNVVKPPKGEKWRSLKYLENLVALHIGPEQARKKVGPLVGIYELRHPDAHLRGASLHEAFQLAGVDPSTKLIFRAEQLLDACVSAIWSIAEILEQPNNDL